MSRPVVAVALPPFECFPVLDELDAAGFAGAPVTGLDDLKSLLTNPAEVLAVILDAGDEPAAALDLRAILRRHGPAIPAILIVSDEALDQFVAAGAIGPDDEIVRRPFDAESIRWRLEAIRIRARMSPDDVPDGGAILNTGHFDVDFGRRAPIVVAFSPKGGVGKTTVATNLGAAVQMRKGQSVLLVDADTVTGHVTTSLALDEVRTVADAWHEPEDDGRFASLLEIASTHSSGMRVAALTLSPLQTAPLEPDRVAQAIEAARSGVALVVVDLHPSYHELNLAIFNIADQILVPVTPDIPAIRAAVQFSDVAAELGVRDRLSMVVNRANSGVSVADMERTVGMASLAQIRSGGFLFVRAGNVGRTVIDLFPRQKISDDFDLLADRVLGIGGAPERATAAARRRPKLASLFGQQELVRS